MSLLPTVVYTSHRALEEFSEAVVSPHKGLVKELKDIIDHLVHSSCCTSTLREYALWMKEVVRDKDFAAMDETVQRRVLEVSDLISQKLKNRGEELVSGISTWLNQGAMQLNDQVLASAFPGDEGELCSFIKAKALKLCNQGGLFGGSVSKELFTLSGKPFVVTYRLRKEHKLQILVYQNLKQGTFSTFQKVALAVGPEVLGTLGPIFARLKLSPMKRIDPSICAQVRRGATISRAMRRRNVANIVEYHIMSRKRQGTTLATSLYKESVMDMLQRFPQGTDTSQTAFSFLSHIAIPVATALSGLHRNSVVHLDVKPENVLLSDRGIAYLGDFGSYRMAGKSESSAITTPVVTAPEVFASDGAWKVTPAQDMWAFGLFLADIFLGPENNSLRNAWATEIEALPGPEKAERIISYTGEIVREFQDSPYCFREFSFPPQLGELISDLLNSEPKARPTAGNVLKKLISLRNSWYSLF